MIQFQENIQTDNRDEVCTDPVSQRILLATARGLTSSPAVDWHFKVKVIDYNVGLTKNYCITAYKKSAQFIQSF